MSISNARFHFSPSDTDAITKRFCNLYDHARGVEPSPDLIRRAKSEIDEWFARILPEITWTLPDEPYATYEAMVEDIENGVFKVKDYVGSGYLSPIWGTHYNKMRAVHDYFGHYAGNNGFGIVGELGAYGVHVGMFSADVMPLIFNEIVLHNASILTHHGLQEDKFVPFVA